MEVDVSSYRDYANRGFGLIADGYAIMGEMPPIELLQVLGGALAFPEDGEVLVLGIILQAEKIDRLFPRGVTRGIDGF